MTNHISYLDPEKVAQIQKMIQEIQDNNDDDDSDISGISSSDDLLSMVSDCSSLDSFCLSPSPKKQKEIVKNLPKEKSMTKIKKTQFSSVSKIPRRKTTQESKQIFRNDFRLAKEIKTTKPILSDTQPVNFLAPDLSAYSFLTVCFHEGIDFTRGKSGERSTYIVAKMHPDLPELTSPICFYQTKHAIYNGGFTQCCQGIDFDKTISIIAVYDFINQETRELIGTCPISFQLAKVEDDMCFVAKKEWLTVYSTQPRIPCGKILVTILFNNDEEKARLYIQNLENQKKVENQKPIYSNQIVSTFPLCDPQVTSNQQPKDEVENKEITSAKVVSATQADPGSLGKSANDIEKEELLSNLGNLFNENRSIFNDEEKPIKETKLNVKPSSKRSPKKHFAGEGDLSIFDSEDTEDDEIENLFLQSPEARIHPQPRNEVSIVSSSTKTSSTKEIPIPSFDENHPQNQNEEMVTPQPSSRKQRFLKYHDFVNV